MELFTDWNDLIQERFELTAMKGQQMRDFKGALGHYYKTTAKDWKISKYKVFNYSAENKLNISTYEDMNAMEEQKFHLLKRPYKNVVYPADPLYTIPCSINIKKLKDVQALARYLREEGRQYIRALTRATTLGDPEEESDYED